MLKQKRYSVSEQKGAEGIKRTKKGSEWTVKTGLKTGSGSLIPVPAIGWVGRLMRGARTGEGKAGIG